MATALGVDLKTVSKWVARFLAEGVEGLRDRTLRPHMLRRPTPTETVEQVIALRRQRFTGQLIAKECRVSPATASRILRACSLNQVRDLEPGAPVVRYEREHPG